MIGARLPNAGAWGWGAPSCPNRTEGRATFSGAPLSWSPPGGLQGETPRIGAGQFAGVARLAEDLNLTPFLRGLGLACRAMVDPLGVPQGSRGGRSRPCRVWDKVPRAGPLCFFLLRVWILPLACPAPAPSPVRGPGGESPRWGSGGQSPLAWDVGTHAGGRAWPW